MALRLFSRVLIGPPPKVPEGVRDQSERSAGKGSDNNGALCAPPRRTKHTHIVLLRPPLFLKTRNNDPPGAPAFVCDPLGHQKLCFSALQSDNTGGDKTKKTKGLNLFLISFAVRANRDKELGSVSLAFFIIFISGYGPGWMFLGGFTAR